MWRPPSLAGRIAVVAGATRGCGRAIAVALGECGATVICTGRSVRGSLASGDARAETIDETAEMVTKAGGRGIAMRCDHTSRDDVTKLAAKVREEHGELHVLINDLWGGDSLTEFGKTLWEHDLTNGLKLLETAVQGHLITSHALLPLLTSKPGGIVVEITDGDHMGYRGSFFYDLAKTSNIRMAFALHKELSKHGCRAFCATPGFLRSEAMLDLFGCTEEDYKTKAEDADFKDCSESPYLLARGVAHLLAEPPAEFGVFGSWALAERYGFTDKDGSSPHWGKHFEAKYGKVLATLGPDDIARWESGPCEAVENAQKRAKTDEA